MSFSILLQLKLKKHTYEVDNILLGEYSEWYFETVTLEEQYPKTPD